MMYPIHCALHTIRCKPSDLHFNVALLQEQTLATNTLLCLIQPCLWSLRVLRFLRKSIILSRRHKAPAS